MRAKLISGGDVVNTSVRMEDGSELRGVVSVKFEIPDCSTPPRLTLTLMQCPVEVEGEAMVFGVHPVDGDQRQIAKIVYADGSDWVAP